MTEREYRNSPGVSRSELWKLNPKAGGSPEKCLWAKANPGQPTKDMIFGTLAHMALLEPDRVEEEFAFIPNIDRRTKGGKAAWEAFEAQLNGRQPISDADWITACNMVHVIQGVPFGRKLLRGSHETVFRWVDDLTGEECKIKADCVFKVGGIPVIVDYKTTTDASTDAFARKAIQMGYDFQAGMYCEGVEKATGVKPRFVFLVQEKTAPFAVNVLEADDAFIQRGKDTFRELIGIYHECMETDNWWGYMGADGAIGTLSLPAWAVND